MIVQDWQTMIPNFPLVQALEKDCFGDSAWDEKTWEKLFKNRDLFAKLEFREATLTGFCVVETISDEAELLRIAVTKDYRRQGNARKMLDQVSLELMARGGRLLFLEVREDNTEAVQFYENYGFQRIGHRNRYYHHPECDALLYSKNLRQP